MYSVHKSFKVHWHSGAACACSQGRIGSIVSRRLLSFHLPGITIRRQREKWRIGYLGCFLCWALAFDLVPFAASASAAVAGTTVVAEGWVEYGKRRILCHLCALGGLMFHYGTSFCDLFTFCLCSYLRYHLMNSPPVFCKPSTSWGHSHTTLFRICHSIQHQFINK